MELEALLLFERMDKHCGMGYTHQVFLLDSNLLIYVVIILAVSNYPGYKFCFHGDIFLYFGTCSYLLML